MNGDIEETEQFGDESIAKGIAASMRDCRDRYEYTYQRISQLTASPQNTMFHLIRVRFSPT